MPQVRIVTNGVSNGARALQETLQAAGVECSRINLGKYNGRRLGNRLNIKWGCFEMPASITGDLLNGCASDVTLNKLSCFSRLAEMGVPVPRFTQSKEEAEGWGAKRIYERHKLRGSEGEGIVVKAQGETLGDAPLYVEGCYGKRREYRIHVFNNGAVTRTFVQQKKRRVTGVEATTEESKIRNLANGWVFAHKEIQAPREETVVAAISAIETFALHFGAVDLIEMDKEGAFVLEINCAPGLQGATLFFYADAIKEVLEGPTESEE